MAYRREIPISVSIDITLKDKNMSTSEVFDFTERYHPDYVFRFCLSVLLQQDDYDQDEIE